MRYFFDCQIETMMESTGEMTFLHPHVPSGEIQLDNAHQRDPLTESGQSGPLEESATLQENDPQQERSGIPGYRNQRSVSGTNEGIRCHILCNGCM